ncbi:MAG: DNA translocase FtsK 4TM domain-containing protein [Candidatus Hydrogenedentota bacterium]
MAKRAWIPAERRSELLGVLILGLAVVLFLALVTDGDQGAVSRHIDGLEDTPNALGTPGAVAAGVLILLFGYAAHVSYCILTVWGIILLGHSPLDRLLTRIVGFVILMTATAGCLHVNSAPGPDEELFGGAVGAFLGSIILPLFGVVGANVIVVTLVLVGILLATDFLFVRWFAMLHGLAVLTLKGIVELWEALHRAQMARRERALAKPGKQGSAKAETAKSPKRQAESAPPAASKERDPSSIRIRPPAAPEPNSAATEPEAWPFGAIPAAKDEQEAASSSAPFDVTEGGNEEDSAADTGEEASPAAALSDEQRTAAENAALMQAGKVSRVQGEEPPNGAAPVVAAQAKQQSAPMPRRKTPDQEELPPDYVYPKRYTKPALNLLEQPCKNNQRDMSPMLRQTSVHLEETLKTFNIQAQVTDVTRGPTITRYELEPAPGIKVSRFLSLADDLALALKAHRVRVEAPIPGKGRVGIEVPNHEPEAVVVRELLESKAFQRHKGALPLALGKDIAGETVIADLASMPHLLVAGATGAGKTVCVKSLLASLLFTKKPEELQLMLIDPKMVELSIFNDIPHLITPVVIDPKKAATSLNWLIMEMEERYRLFAHLQVRNIDVYNESVENGEIEIPGEEGQEAGESMNVIRKLPYIVCIIDELADLMMLARAEVEDAIARLAQLARAVGIHLVIATQRPSVDVLTGVIKANFPARVSFQVSSRVDSRCILDAIGAERLIGRGDMLYLPAGQSKPTRIQSSFVSDDEMDRLIRYLKTQAPPQYRDEIEKFGKTNSGGDELEEESDELFDEAVRVVTETGQASISMVQRRLRVGYTRAARLIDMMEMRGIVGPHSGSKAREILVDSSS